MTRGPSSWTNTRRPRGTGFHVFVLAWLSVSVLVGCCSAASEREAGWADVRFDGIPLGADIVWRSGNPITCERDQGTRDPTLITSRGRWCCDYIEFDRVPRGPGADGPRASMRLLLTPVREAASVEFSIGDAKYSGTAARVEPDWSDGRAVFRDVRLTTGPPTRTSRS